MLFDIRNMSERRIEIILELSEVKIPQNLLENRSELLMGGGFSGKCVCTSLLKFVDKLPHKTLLNLC